MILVRKTSGAPRRFSFRRALSGLEAYFYLAPSLLVLLLVLLIPLVIGISYSFRNLVVFEPWNTGFVGLSNYRELLNDSLFLRALGNTLRWTLASLTFQFFLGLGLALLLLEPFHGRGLYQALVFLPWAVPAFISGLAWSWLFNPTVGPIPHGLAALGVMSEPLNILSDPRTALWGPIVANIWFGIPFFAITLLAALQAIPSEMYEAASIDGASISQKFRFVTLPFIAPTIAITLLLRTVWIANFPDLIWVMTSGGPANASQIVPSYVFSLAYTKLDFGYASTVAVVLLLLLILYAIAMLQLRRRWAL